MANITNDLKKLYSNIVDIDGNFLTKEQHVKRMIVSKQVNHNYKITDRQYKLFLGIMYLVMNTKITSTNTKNYIRSNESSVKRFVDSYNSTVEENEQLKAASVSQNVNYDKNKLLDFFPEDTISKITAFGWEDRIADYEKMLNNARAKYAGNRKILNNLVLNISKTAVNDSLTEEEFKELLIIIAPYTKHQIKYVSENLPIKYAGYMNYLVSAHKLEGEDLKRFKHFRALLEGEEFIEPEEIGSTEQEDIKPDEIETIIEDKEQDKGGLRETEVIKAGGLKSTRIQYDPNMLSSEDEFDIDIEDIDFGDLTDADVE